MTAGQFEVVAEDDPTRCKGTTAQGQCKYRAVPETDYCKMHGGGAAKSRLVKQEQRKYKLAVWQDRVNEFADDTDLKSVNDEIGILRMTLEGVLNACKTNQDLLLYAPKISDLVAKVEKLVVTCHKLEAAAGITLTKAAAAALAVQIVDIVDKHVKDPDAVAAIAEEIGSAIANAKGEEFDG